jgi:hypothetical protein
MYPRTASWQSENSMVKKVISLGMKLRVQEMFFFRQYFSILMYKNLFYLIPSETIYYYEIQGYNPAIFYNSLAPRSLIYRS